MKVESAAMTDPIKTVEWGSLLPTPRPTLAHSVYDLDHCRVIELTGECDVATSEHLRTMLCDALPEPPVDLVLDLTHVTFMDAHSTSILLSTTGSHSLAVVGASGIVARVLDLLDPNHRLTRGHRLPDTAATSLD
jgi:anti-anti-sigma factor